MLRVAALQFAPGPDTEQNLTCCLQLIERAVREHGAQLLVLPEGSNHAPGSVDSEGTRGSAATLEGPFLSALSAACSQHKVHLVVGVSLLSDEQVTSSALLFSADGSLLGRADRQVLSSDLARSHSVGLVGALAVQTEIGHVGLCVGQDSAAMEAVRSLALAGAELVCVPFGPDCNGDVTAHLAARALENRIFMIGAAGQAAPQAPTRSPGRSQVLAPDGTLSVLAPDDNEGLVVCELELQQAQNKLRADGTDIFALRRPELYRPLLGKVLRERGSQSAARASWGGPAADDEPSSPTDSEPSLQVALLSTVDAGSVAGAIESAAGFVRELAQQGTQLVVLPELFCFEGGQVADPEAAAAWFLQASRSLSEACAGAPTHVVTSLVERTAQGFAHVGLVIGHAGIVARAGQLHVPARHGWATPARRFELLPLPWGKVALLVGEDAIVPEAARALSLLGAELLVATLGSDENVATLLTAAALENGVAVVAGMRSSAAGGGFLIDPASGSGVVRAGAEQSVLGGSVRRVPQRLGLLERPYRSAQGLLASNGGATA